MLSLLLASLFTLVELNCENLFDTSHDEGKLDTEFLPDGPRRWTSSRYWRKLNNIGQELLSCADELPDLAVLVEVENDAVLCDLTSRSMLRNAGYRYLMTASDDARGIDVALLYQPARFSPICYEVLQVPPLPEMRATHDILYVKGETQAGDTLHVFAVHAPSRFGGELRTRPYRRHVADIICQIIGTLGPDARVVIAGDFNDEADDPSLEVYEGWGLHNLTRDARGTHGAKGTYRYQGRWSSIDHVLASRAMSERVDAVYVHDAPFLLEEDTKYGGVKPFRTFNGFKYQQGFSDHLPLVVKFRME